MTIALCITLITCTILLAAALHGIDRHLAPVQSVKVRKRAPGTLGRARRGRGLHAPGFDALLSSGLAVRPPPRLSI